GLALPGPLVTRAAARPQAKTSMMSTRLPTECIGSLCSVSKRVESRKRRSRILGLELREEGIVPSPPEAPDGEACDPDQQAHGSRVASGGHLGREGGRVTPAEGGEAGPEGDEGAE